MPKDRNAHAREEFQQAQQRRAFAAAVSQGQAAALDRLGRPVRQGDLVLWHPPDDLIFEVLGVSVPLDPRMPPGVLTMTLGVTVPVNVQANTPVRPLLHVGRVPAEAEAAPAEAAPTTEGTGDDDATIEDTQAHEEAHDAPDPDAAG